MRDTILFLLLLGMPVLVHYPIRRRYRRHLGKLSTTASDLRRENIRLRERNVAATAEALEFETQLEITRTDLANARAARDRDRVTLEAELLGERMARAEATKRAETAEGVVRGQAKHIEALQASNDTMLTAITDMRRVGFSLPSDILNEPDPEGITSVHDDDLAAVKANPDFMAPLD